MHTIIADVTQADIDGGERQTAINCPIARSLGRDRPELCVDVFARWLTAWENTGVGDFPVVCRTLPLHAEAVAFVRAFDYGEPVSPGRVLVYESRGDLR